MAGALVASVVLVYAGQLFGLNGAQWDWWRRACFAGAVVLFAVVLLRPRLQAAAKRVPRGVLPAGAVSGAALLAAALATMSVRYSDPYDGPLFWPHALALLGLLGFAASSVSVFASSRGRA